MGFAPTRPGPAAGKLQSLEMLRAAAAILVVLFHTQFIFGVRIGHIPFGNFFGAGFRGVDLFFVLSGFIIAYVHGGDVGRPERLPNYLFNRLARIYPAVWIMTILAIAVYASGFGDPDKTAKLAPQAMLASVLLLPQHGEALVNVTWTLTYEIFFYAVFAVAIVSRLAGLAILLVWQVATVAATVSGADLGLAGYYLAPACLEFSVGLAIAWWVRRQVGGVHPAIWYIVLAFGLASFVLGMAADQARSWAGFPCALGAGAMILALVRLEQAQWLRVPGVLVRLGGASYAIYLVHFSTITLLAAILTRLDLVGGDWLCLACAVAGVLAGLIFDFVIDRPIQRWLRQQKAAILRRPLLQSS